MTPQIKIEIWSDLVCPWCYVGLGRLQQALAARPALQTQLEWHAFELNPDIPEAGLDRAAYMQAKFGDSKRFAGVQDQLRQLAQSLGLDYRIELQTRMPNTRRAHMLILAAAASGRQTAVKAALMQGYFAAGRDLGSAADLTELACGAGLDAASVAAALGSQDLRVQVERDLAQARAWNISGVPTFVFNRQVGFSGAQELPEFLSAIDQVAAV